MRAFWGRYWQWVLFAVGQIPAIWEFFKWAADWRGRYDAVSASLNEIGGWRGMTAFLISPPPWFPLAASAISVALILWHFKRSAPASKPNSLGNDNIEQQLSYLYSRDVDLGSAIASMARKSAWGRWYAAQHLVNNGCAVAEQYILQIASSIVWRNILDGDLKVRCRRPCRLDYEEIPRTHWRSSAFCFVGDDKTLWKMVIHPTGGAEIAASGEVVRASDPAAAARTSQLAEYDSFLVDAYQFEKLWPATDVVEDKARNKLLKDARSRHLDKDEIKRLT